MKIVRFLLSLFVVGSAVAAQNGDASDKKVLVRGWKNEELRQILDDFKAMYRDRLADDFRMKVQRMPEDLFCVTFPSDISATLFAWLVNYLRYPKDFDLRTRAIVVLGRTTISAEFEPPEKKLIGQRAAFYVPADDQEYDLVFVKVGVVTYELSFARGEWTVVANDRMPAGLDKLMEDRSSSDRSAAR